ncbi:MAG: hypothetical protein H6662_15605 [Ardenticatenaceae bacterium]|nr:hypothetical protein [Anaerolineales bacterium]MCB8923013.1 hypothetical protein [Ardenticatenaceae bacterium]
MTVPSAYSEATLKTYLHGILSRGGIAATLDWQIEAGSYDEIITDTLLAYGVDDIAEATDVAKLRALARLALWEAVETAVPLEINYTADGATFNREAIFQHVQTMLQRARLDAFAYTDDYQVDVLGVQRDYDPYDAIDFDLLEDA